MAKISRHLTDIEKLVQKQQQTPKQQLEEVKKELELLKDVKIKGFDNKEITTTKEDTLKEAEKILIDKIEDESLKKEILQEKNNNFIDKRLKKEIELSLFDELLTYFEEFRDKKRIFTILNKSDIKKEIVKEYINTYGADFTIYLYDIYDKLLKKCKNIYIEDIKEQEEEEKQQKQAIKDYNRRRKEKQKNRIAFNVGIIGLLTLANKKKKKW